VQWEKRLPADDDGIWWFKLPSIGADIQIESTYGNCPFLVETNELCCDKAKGGETVADVGSMIVEYLDSQRGRIVRNRHTRSNRDGGHPVTDPVLSERSWAIHMKVGRR
ncbi:MAG TPA: hypothetical protein VJ464_26340, partial [Blastocatellia bacterium]|nr:hypothetical protein [Blastocatellia bacterium]